MRNQLSKAAALGASSGPLADVAECAGVGLTVLERSEDDLRFVWVNRAFTATTGYAPEEMLGHSMRSFYQYRWENVGFEQIAEQVERGEGVELVLPFRMREGTDRWLRVSIQALPRASGEPDRWVSTTMDVTAEMEKGRPLVATTDHEWRAHGDLVLLSQVSDVLSGMDSSKMLAEAASLLSKSFARWAGFLLVRDGLRLVDGVAKTWTHGSRVPEHSGDPVDQLLNGRIGGPLIFALGGNYAEETTSRRLQDEVRGSLEGAAEDVGELEGGPEGESAVDGQVLLEVLPGTGQNLGLLAAMPRRGGFDGFDGRDRTLLEVFARRVGMAVENMRLYLREHQLAETLQLAMLPEQAEVSGLDVWTYYSPNSNHAQVGGDWYDVLQITPEVAGIVVGDVVGHDIEAAATMGQLRSIVRAYAFEVVEPGPVLDRVDQLVEGLGLARAASLVYSTLRQTGENWELEYSIAGHLPPLLIRDGQVSQLGAAGGSLIGFGSKPRQTGQESLVPEDVIIVFTDGLIERRERPLRVGLERLEAIASQTGVSDAAGVGEQLLTLLDQAPEDDVAVVVVRIPPTQRPTAGSDDGPRSRRWTLPSEETAVARARHVVLMTATAWGSSNARNAELVVSELFANAVLHGWGPITLRLFETGDGLRIEVEDANPAPPLAVDGHINGVGGYGIQIVSRLADWGWRPTPPGKTVWAKLRSGAAPFEQGECGQGNL